MKLSQEILTLLDESIDGKWSINPETGLVDVNGSVIISLNHIKNGKLPVKFGVVSGSFYCNDIGLTTLEGSPYWVGEDFDCSENELNSLKYAPLYVKKQITVTYNPLQKIEWVPDKVGKLRIDFDNMDEKYDSIIIPEIEALISKGVKIISYWDGYKKRRFNLRNS